MNHYSTLYPKNPLAQIVLQALVYYQIKHIIICPGSRNAPLTIGFMNKNRFHCYSLVDERSAGFVALGMAQGLKTPVAVVCTSGSATTNLYPAVVEAFYSNTPLLILSADRPSHMIDIGDGQCIHQKGIFGKHCKVSKQLTHCQKINQHKVQTAIQVAIIEQIPTHLNLPFEEPLYETTHSPKQFSFKPMPTSRSFISKIKILHCQKIWKNSKKKMILIGTIPSNPILLKQLKSLVRDPSVLIITEATSNLPSKHFIRHIDILLTMVSTEDKESYARPNLLITAGGHIVSKKIKQFLRSFPPKHHWHIDTYTKRDTFFCLTKHIQLSIDDFLKRLPNKNKEYPPSHYQSNMLALQNKAMNRSKENLQSLPLCDLKVFETINKNLPAGYILHFSNSSIVRYAQLFAWQKYNPIYANRGVAGIEGCTSTAVGHAMVNKSMHLLITGDLSFFYDNNALWNKYLKGNFLIVLINNSGGGIFHILPDPKNTTCLEYFTTPHHLTAQHLCKMHGIDYTHVENLKILEKVLPSFLQKLKTPKLLEVKTDKHDSSVALKTFFSSLK